MRSRITLACLWKVHQSMRASSDVDDAGVGPSKYLSCWTHDVTFSGLMNRGSLPILHTVYLFIRNNNEHSVGSLWPTIRAFKGVLVLLVQDRWRAWNRLVSSNNAIALANLQCAKPAGSRAVGAGRSRWLTP